MCRHVCPVGHVTRKETLTPHGWGLAIASVQRGLLSWNPETVDVLYSCADCGTCRAFCVTDRALPDAIAGTRAEVASQGLSPAVAYEIHNMLQEWSNPYQKHKPEAFKGKGEIALFVGDDAKYLWPGELEAALKLLAAVGVNPVLIGAGRNNGYLASSLGFPETAKSLIQSTLDELKDSRAKTMFVLAPGDYYAFSQLLVERLDGEWLTGIEIKEVLPFLAGELAAGKLKLKISNEDVPYAYVDPTHSLRVPTRFDAPRNLLAAILPGAGRELFWRKERAHPCGNVALQFTNPHIADHLTYARLADAREVGARSVITEDAGCLFQLNRYAERFGLRVRGLYGLLADHLV